MRKSLRDSQRDSGRLDSVRLGQDAQLIPRRLHIYLRVSLRNWWVQIPASTWQFLSGRDYLMGSAEITKVCVSGNGTVVAEFEAVVLTRRPN